MEYMLERYAHWIGAVGSDPLVGLALLSAGVAALLVIVSAFVKTMIPLRWLAVASNFGFIVYGLLYPAPLMVALHAAAAGTLRNAEVARLLQDQGAVPGGNSRAEFGAFLRSENEKWGEVIRLGNIQGE